MKALKKIPDHDAVPPIDMVFALHSLHFDILEYNKHKTWVYSLVYCNKHPDYPVILFK